MSDELFKKYDGGKPEFDIVSQFTRELGIVNQTLQYGAEKYGMDNWKQAGPEDLRRYRNACVRHVLSSFKHDFDSDSDLPHWSHAIVNLLFIAYLENVFNGKSTQNLQ